MIDRRSPSCRILQLALMAVCFGLIIAWASLALRLTNRPDTLYNLSAILDGRPLVFSTELTPLLPFYNRILFPTIHRGLVEAVPFISAGQWYILLRVATCMLAVGTFTAVCHRTLGTSLRDCWFTTSLLALSMIVTFCYPWEDPTDAFDICALSLGVLAAIEGRFLLALAVGVFFACNRESSAYIGILWFFLSSRPHPWWRRAIESGTISVASYAVALGLRLWISATGTANMFMLFKNAHALLDAFRQFPVNWLGLLLAIVAILLANIDFRNRIAVRLLVLAALFVGPAVIFGMMNELRVSMPTFLMLVFAVAASRSADGPRADIARL